MSRRRLSDDERTLWKGVTRSIAPLRRARGHSPGEGSPTAAEIAVKPASKRPSKTGAKPAAAGKSAAAKSPAGKPAPPLVPLGRRFRQQLARGSRAIDSRLDLHGMTQAQAHVALLRFVRTMQARGGKVVLVITGKGGGDFASGRGVLKRQVPQWLALPEFRSLIVGFEAAGIGHGGEGALYVTLRRGRGE
jgi:DNA-nicking Smr family endonuclease